MGYRNEEGEASASPEFVIRDLQASDIWQLVRILSKMGIRDLGTRLDTKLLAKSQFRPPEMLDEQGKRIPLPRDQWTEAQIEMEMQAEMAGDELVWQVLGFAMENMGSCEAEVNKLLADSIGKTPDQLRRMPANDYLDLIVAYVSREEFRDFFTRAWRLLDKKDFRKSSGSAIAALMNS